MDKSQSSLQSIAATQSSMPLFYGVYSYSGFDIISLLAKIVHRKNPKVNLGPIDLSSAFVVASAKQFDYPIVYASQTFEILTGYSSDDIIGKNCRFLQSPDGIVERGAERVFSDNSVIFKLKNSIDSFEECQYMNINFKKNGQPFVNLITVVPVVEPDGDVNYFIGFQVDIQSQAKGILTKLDDGSYVFDNAQPTFLEVPPSPLPLSLPPPPKSSPLSLSHSNLSILSSRSDTDQQRKRKKTAHPSQSFNIDPLVTLYPDMILILSSRGIILFASANALGYLGYAEGELVGVKLNDLVFPGDMIQLMREMKGYKVQAPLSFTIRIKHATSLSSPATTSPYAWFNIIGHKTQMQNCKKTKSFVFSARPTTIHLEKSYANGLVQAAMTIKTSRSIATDLWARVSLTGLFLRSAPIFGVGNDEVCKGSLFDYVLTDFHPILKKCLASQTAQLVSVQARLNKTTNITVEIHFQRDGDKYLCRLKYPGSDGDLRGSLVNHMIPDTSESTSIQYEVNQLKMMNKRLHDEISRMTSARLV